MRHPSINMALIASDCAPCRCSTRRRRRRSRWRISRTRQATTTVRPGCGFCCCSSCGCGCGCGCSCSCAPGTPIESAARFPAVPAQRKTPRGSCHGPCCSCSYVVRCARDSTSIFAAPEYKTISWSNGLQHTHYAPPEYKNISWPSVLQHTLLRGFPVARAHT